MAMAMAKTVADGDENGTGGWYRRGAGGFKLGDPRYVSRPGEGEGGGTSSPGKDGRRRGLGSGECKNRRRVRLKR
jgi:hypothetical protein